MELYPDYADVRKAVMDMKREIDSYPCKKVPCHNDPLCENWVRGTERMYLVDWEYAGMNDPMWDLADLSIEAEYGDHEDGLLLDIYFNGKVNNIEKLRFYANKIYLDFCGVYGAKQECPMTGMKWNNMRLYVTSGLRRVWLF